MESISSEKREIVLDILVQVKESIENLMSWNQGITDMNKLLMSLAGMQDLAGNCMTIMAIGEEFIKDCFKLLQVTETQIETRCFQN